MGNLGPRSDVGSTTTRERPGPPGTVGIIVNPWAGKDIRRLHAPVGHTPDTVKVGIVRRIAIAALEAGADQVLAGRDLSKIAERALSGIDNAEVIDGPSTGSALDTQRAASQLRDRECSVVAVLGGDGTCRDVVIGWPDITMVAVSTGTNNVFPRFIDGSSAGTAAGLVASGAIEVDSVTRKAKVLRVAIHRDNKAPELPAADRNDLALVDVALTTDVHTGARAILDSTRIRAVVAAIATPQSTGLSSIAGRLQPVGRHEPVAASVTLDGHRTIRAPLVPGSFDDVSIQTCRQLVPGEEVQLQGPGSLALDGERLQTLSASSYATVTLDLEGPNIIDVEQALLIAASNCLFDTPSTQKEHHGD